MAFVARLKGFVLAVAGLLAATLGVFIFGGFTLPLFFIKPNLYRSFFDLMLGLWSHYIVALLEIFMGVKVKITGDVMKPGERSLILMNHRTRLDWMYFWSVLIRQSGISTEKVILKSPLKKIPGLGWAMQVGAFIFIERKWEDDKKILTKMIDYFADLKYKTQVLLFPEGTDLTARTKAKSDEFARKNNVSAYDYVLHPRTTGFTFITQHMRKKDHLDAVYDVSVAYPCNIPQQELDLVTGNFPQEVHFHIKRHVVQSLPLTEDGLQTWCRNRWNEKEDRLKKFYEKGEFEEEDEEQESDNHIKLNGEQSIKSCEENNITENCKRSVSHRKEMDMKRDAKARLYMQIALVTWTIFVCAIITLIVYSSFACWTAFLQVIFFVFMTKKYGGFEYFQVDYYNRFFKDKSVKKLE